MFHYSLRWGRKSYNFFVLKDGKYIKSTLNNEGSQLYGKDRYGAFIKSNRTDKAAYNNGLLSPLDIDSFAGKGDMYGYDLVDQNGNPLPSIKDLQPIIDKIEAAIGINMKDYDSVIGNIYLPGEYVYPHKDTSESKSARNYPVIVYSIGNDAGLGIVDNNEGKMTFANQYDERFLPANDKLKGYTNEILTKHGSIYTFGMDGKGRFELTHSTPTNSKKDKLQTPITLPNGKVVTNYTITLTFRRAADLEPGMPIAPAKITTQSSTTTQPQAETEVETQNLTTTNEPNVFIFDDSKTKTADYYRNITSANSTVGFVFNASKDEIEKNITLGGQSLLRFVSPDTALPFITSMTINSDNFSNLAPESYQSVKDYFDRKIQEYKNAKDLGTKIALPIEGIGNSRKMPQELFVYLSKRLFEELGYINPGSTMYKDITEIINNKQGISDDEILASLGFESDPFNCV